MITQTTNLNLIPYGPPIVIHCDQYDEGTGRLIFNLYENDIAYTPTGTAVIQGTKPDNHGFNYNCTMVGNVVTADLTEQMTAVAGPVRCQIVVTESDGRTGSFAFILEVQMSALPDDTVLSDSDFQLIQQAIQDSAQAVIDAEDSAEDAEAWAVGERNGVPVTSGDPTYENNAKYWSSYSGTLTHLSDVTISAPQDEQVLTYDANTAQWVNAAAGGVPALSSLPDVNITTVSDGQALRYDSNSGKWINEAVADDITDLSDVTISAPTDGQALVYDSSDQEWKNETITATTTLGNLTDVSLSSVQDGQALVYDSNSTSWKNKKIVDADAVHWDEQAVLGAKNRLPNNAISQTLYDVVWTKNADDSLTANGTADATNNSIITVFGPVTGAYLKNLLGSNVTYKMSGCPSGGSASTYYFRCYKVSPWAAIADNYGDAETTLNTSVFEDNAQYSFVCVVNRGIQADNFVFKPMLSLDGGAYVPYAMTNRELTDKVKLKTVTPTVDGTIIKTYKGGFVAYNLLTRVCIFAMSLEVGAYANYTNFITGLPKPKTVYSFPCVCTNASRNIGMVVLTTSSMYFTGLGQAANFADGDEISITGSYIISDDVVS